MKYLIQNSRYEIMFETFITKFITNIYCYLLLVLIMSIQKGTFCLSENNFASLSSSTTNYLNGKHFRFTSVQVLHTKKLTISLLNVSVFQSITVPPVCNGTTLICEWLVSCKLWWILLRNNQHIKIYLQFHVKNNYSLMCLSKCQQQFKDVLYTDKQKIINMNTKLHA